MRTQRLMAGLLAGMLVVACTGTDPAEEETEVQGLVLEREDPEASGDGETPDPSDAGDDADADEVDEADEADEAPDDTAVGRDRGGSSSSSGPSTTGGSGGSSTGPTGTSGGGSSSRAPQGDAPPSEPAPEREPSPQPDPPTQPEPEPEPEPGPEPEPEPQPEPEPEPEPEVAPARLEDGFERSGTTWSVQDGEWVEASSRSHAPDRPLVEAGLVTPEDPDAAAPERDARCAVVLHAPRDRGLRAEGELEVVLVAEDRDGERTSLLRYILDLDVELAADTRSAMSVPDRSHTVARDEVASVSCEVRYTAR